MLLAARRVCEVCPLYLAGGDLGQNTADTVGRLGAEELNGRSNDVRVTRDVRRTLQCLPRTLGTPLPYRRQAQEAFRARRLYLGESSHPRVRTRKAGPRGIESPSRKTERTGWRCWGTGS